MGGGEVETCLKWPRTDLSVTFFEEELGGKLKVVGVRVQSWVGLGVGWRFEVGPHPAHLRQMDASKSLKSLYFRCFGRPHPLPFWQGGLGPLLLEML